MKYLSISILLALPASILATEGGRCAYGWGPECICLDANVCTDSYGGFANAGWEGNWPCPSDASNVVGCTINPCPGYEDDWNSNTDCRWSESCGGVVLEAKFACEVG